MLAYDKLTATLNTGAKQLGVVLKPVDASALLDYLSLLNRWNNAVNLTAVREPGDQIALHLLDSLSIVPPLQSRLTSDAVVADIGSGGGLPGIVLAICAPQVQVHCIDAVGKKAAFMTQVKGALGLKNLSVHHSRVEALQAPADLPPATLIVSRAFASLAQFTSLTADLLARGGVWAAMKGMRPDDELAALSEDVEVESVTPLTVPALRSQRHLIVMRRR